MSPRRAATSLAVTIVAHDVGPVGGMERQLTELIRGLLAREVDVTVISRTCELEQHPRLCWVRVPGPARPFVLAYPWFFLVGSLLARRHSRGVLHTTGAIVFNRADVSTVHLCHHSRSARALRRASRATPLHLLNARASGLLARAAERLVYRRTRTTALVSVSEDVAKEVVRHFPGTAVHTIPNGVDPERFRPNRAARDAVRAELGLRDDTLVAVFVGGEWREKGLPVAIEAVQQATGWALLVVGPGDPTPYGSSGVHFAGRQERPEPYYAASDAFIFPSAHEGAPLVVLEAAASGLPLLVSDVGGTDELVVDGRTGWRLERDPDSFADKLRRLDDPSLRAELGAAARRVAAQRGWEPVVDSYVALYRAASTRSTRRSVRPARVQA